MAHNPSDQPSTAAQTDEPDSTSAEEPVTTGTVFLTLIFLMMIFGFWIIMYWMLLDR